MVTMAMGNEKIVGDFFSEQVHGYMGESIKN
jgi:hypothetical protein